MICYCEVVKNFRMLIQNIYLNVLVFIFKIINGGISLYLKTFLQLIIKFDYY